MSTPLLIIVTAIYGLVAVDFARRGNGPMAVVFAGYAVANVGFIAATR
jgi:hypothetical protein